MKQAGKDRAVDTTLARCRVCTGKPDKLAGLPDSHDAKAQCALSTLHAIMAHGIWDSSECSAEVGWRGGRVSTSGADKTATAAHTLLIALSSEHHSPDHEERNALHVGVLVPHQVVDDHSHNLRAVVQVVDGLVGGSFSCSITPLSGTLCLPAAPYEPHDTTLRTP